MCCSPSLLLFAWHAEKSQPGETSVRTQKGGYTLTTHWKGQTRSCGWAWMGRWGTGTVGRASGIRLEPVAVAVTFDPGLVLVRTR